MSDVDDPAPFHAAPPAEPKIYRTTGGPRAQ